jgi:hypothetical protein
MNEDATRRAVTGYTTWLKQSLSGYEDLAKTLVQHKAEKGRIVESVVKTALRAILPGRFSIGTGFIISSGGQSSTQLDLVIYDAFYNSPIVLERGTGLFPVECVYGLVEVKSRLDQNEIDSITKAIHIVRELAKEKRYAHYVERKHGSGKTVVAEAEISTKLAPRAFVVAINSAYADVNTIEAALRDYTEKNGAHIHGLTVLEKNWFFGQEATFGRPNKFLRREEGAFEAFCASVLASIQSIAMGPASMRRYLGLVTDDVSNEEGTV